ncbi:hypothetical protein QFZ28_001692 [Neobacillus niacini]|nr:hypothetical protein [Neobacillus niacini]
MGPVTTRGHCPPQADSLGKKLSLEFSPRMAFLFQFEHIGKSVRIRISVVFGQD